MLIRIGRRREVFANNDPAEVIASEFTFDGELDLNPSIYQIQINDLTRCHAEHTASANLDPKGRTNYDLENLCSSVDAPLNERFSFISHAHREIQLRSKDELLSMIASLMLDIDSRKHKTEKSSLKKYVSDRVTTGDEEWIHFLREPGNSEKWA
jgi:hypothetical protein